MLTNYMPGMFLSYLRGVPLHTLVSIYEGLAEAGVAIELNGRYSVEHVEFLELAKSYGCVFSLGSDSHHSSTVGDLEFQEKLATSMNLDIIKIR